MALQVWLPLNGDTQNLGLDTITFVQNTGATIDNAGKIGKCYSFDASDDWIQYTINKTKYSNKPLSYTYWFKCDQTDTGGIIIDLAADLCASYSYSSSGIKFSYWRCYSSSGSRAGDSGTTPNFYDAAQWHHVAVIFNANINQIYVDGVLALSDNKSSKYTTYWQPLLAASYNRLSIGRSAGDSNWIGGKVNDVRLYDHALSAEEVREIANGLVLHYPLNDDDFEATTNISTGTLGSNAYNGATSKYNYGTTTDMYKTTGVFQGRQCTKVYMGTNNLSAYPYVWFDNLHPAQNAYKTLSFDYYPTALTSVIFYTYNGSATATYKVNGTSGTGGTIPVQVNEWNHIELTLLGTSANTSGWGYMRIGSAAHTSSTSNYWLFDNIQIEEKDHATAYVVGSRTAGNITDNSGYHHHGTINSTPIINNETKRYNNSLLFDGVDDCITVPYNEICPENIFTFNLWFKKNALGSKNYETLFGGPSGFEMDTRSGSSSTISLYMAGTRGGNRNAVTSMSLGNWYMITMTRDGSKEKYYVNGIYQSEIDAKAMPTGVYRIGAWASNTGQNYYGLISDFRIYNTVLSEAEILKLYNSGMVFDKGGSIHTHQFNEYSTTASLEKTAILNGTGFDEIAMCQYDSKIYQEPDGSKWIRIFHHNDPTTSGYFTRTSDWENGVYKSADAWYDIERVLTYRSSQYYEFMVKQKTTSSATEAKYRWSQIANPITAVYNDVKPGTVVFNTSTGYTNSTFGGLYKMNSSSRMNIANASSGNWYGAMGSWTTYSTNQVPAFPNTTLSTGYMDLYLRVDIDLRKDKIWQSLQLIER